MSKQYNDLTGLTIGKLTVLRRSVAKGKARWFCICACGNETLKRDDHLRERRVTSCAHCPGRGRSLHPLYGTWSHMINRCTDPTAHNYRWYGALGVNVCDRWLDSFEAFIEDVGERPVGTTLDRFPDKNGNYEPGNVRWATKLQQGNNARNNRLFTIDGMTRTLKEWSRVFDVNYLRLYKQVVTNSRPLLEAVDRLRTSGARVERLDSQQAQIKALIKNGMTVDDIAQTLGVHRSSIYKARRALGIRRPRRSVERESRPSTKPPNKRVAKR